MIVNDSHRRRGYDLSANGYYVAYHYFIGTDGTVVQTRPDTDRTMHSRNDYVNMRSVAIVLAGAFNSDQPSYGQKISLAKLVTRLQKKYKIPATNVIGHREASPTQCPGTNLMNLIQAIRRREGLPLTQKIPMPS